MDAFYGPLEVHLEHLSSSPDEECSYHGFCKRFAPHILEMRNILKNVLMTQKEKRNKLLANPKYNFTVPKGPKARVERKLREKRLLQLQQDMALSNTEMRQCLHMEVVHNSLLPRHHEANVDDTYYVHRLRKTTRKEFILFSEAIYRSLPRHPFIRPENPAGRIVSPAATFDKNYRGMSERIAIILRAWMFYINDEFCHQHADNISAYIVHMYGHVGSPHYAYARGFSLTVPSVSLFRYDVEQVVDRGLRYRLNRYEIIVFGFCALLMPLLILGFLAHSFSRIRNS